MLQSLSFAVWIAASLFSLTQGMEEASSFGGRVSGMTSLPKQEVEIRLLGPKVKASEVPRLDADKIVSDFQKSRKKLIMLDKNGVLKRPEGISPEEKQEIIKILQDLSNDPNTDVWVNSASTFEKLEHQFDQFPGLHLAAEHGAVTGRVGQPLKQSDIHAPLINVEDLRKDVELFIGHKMKEIGVDWGWLRTYGRCSDAFEIRTKPADVSKILDELRADLDKNGYHLTVEHIYPADWVNLIPEKFNKGKPVAELIQKAEEKGEPYDFGIAIGNEKPDEYMYEVMNNAKFHSAIVTDLEDQLTTAKYRIEGNHKNVLRLLQLFTKRGAESVDDPLKSKPESKLVGSSEQ